MINISAIMFLWTSSTTGTWSCYLLQFMTVTGEINSIFFPVLICIFRYQKLRDVNKRVSVPLFLDSVRSAWTVSGICLMLNQEHKVENITGNRNICPPDFFRWTENHCPMFHRGYKYLFIVLCHLLPLIIITVTSCLILIALPSHRKIVTPAVRETGSSQFSRKSKDTRIQWSTVAVLAAMGLFQVDWTIYLILHVAFSPSDVPYWSEIQLFIATSSTSPYVYGTGHKMISLNSCKKR